MSSWERTWVVKGDHKNVYRCGKPLEFSLKRGTAGGPTYYEIKFEAGHNCPPEWDNCTPVPRGTFDYEWPDPDHLLPLYTEDTKDEYRIAAEKQLALMNTSTRRLEGELDFGDRTKVVYFFVVRKAIDDTVTGRVRDLLIVTTSSKFRWTQDAVVGSVNVAVGDPIDDGTATGDPK